MKYNMRLAFRATCENVKTSRYYADAVTVTGEVATISDPAAPRTAEDRSFRSSEGAFEGWLILAFFFFLSKPAREAFAQ